MRLCVCCSEAAAHAVATLAEATLQGGGQIVLAETAAAVGALAGDATGTYSCLMSHNDTQHPKYGSEDRIYIEYVKTSIELIMALEERDIF